MLGMFLPLCVRRGSSSASSIPAVRCFVCVSGGEEGMGWLCFINTEESRKPQWFGFLPLSAAFFPLPSSSSIFFLGRGNPLTSRGCVLLHIPPLPQKNVCLIHKLQLCFISMLTGCAVALSLTDGFCSLIISYKFELFSGNWSKVRSSAVFITSKSLYPL